MVHHTGKCVNTVTYPFNCVTLISKKGFIFVAI